MGACQSSRKQVFTYKIVRAYLGVQVLKIETEHISCVHETTAAVMTEVEMTFYIYKRLPPHSFRTKRGEKKGWQKARPTEVTKPSFTKASDQFHSSFY